MVKNDLVSGAARAADVTHLRAGLAVETLLDALRQSLARGDRIELRGFGSLLVKARVQRIGRNPKRPTEEMLIPRHFAIRFKPGKELQDLVNDNQPRDASTSTGGAQS